MLISQKCVYWKWTSFFAILPVRITEGDYEGKIAWLCTVQRRYRTNNQLDFCPTFLAYRMEDTNPIFVNNKLE